MFPKESRVTSFIETGSLSYFVYSWFLSLPLCAGPVKSNKMADEEERITITAPPLTHKSDVWKYFGLKTVNGKVEKDIVICRTCGMQSKYTGQTTNMQWHVKRKHKVSTRKSVFSDDMRIVSYAMAENKHLRGNQHSN